MAVGDGEEGEEDERWVTSEASRPASHRAWLAKVGDSTNEMQKQPRPSESVTTSSSGPPDSASNQGWQGLVWEGFLQWVRQAEATMGGQF